MIGLIRPAPFGVSHHRTNRRVLYRQVEERGSPFQSQLRDKSFESDAADKRGFFWNELKPYPKAAAWKSSQCRWSCAGGTVAL